MWLSTRVAVVVNGVEAGVTALVSVDAERGETGRMGGDEIQFSTLRLDSL